MASAGSPQSPIPTQSPTSQQSNKPNTHHNHAHNHNQQPTSNTAADIMPSFGNNGAGRIGRYQIIKTLGEGSFGKVKCTCFFFFFFVYFYFFLYIKKY